MFNLFFSVLMKSGSRNGLPRMFPAFSRRGSRGLRAFLPPLLLTGAVAFLLALSIHAVPLAAQEPGILGNGDLVISGFSGNVNRGDGSTDSLFIDLDGAALKVFSPGNTGPRDARLLAVSPTFEVFARDIGQVFGITLDDAEPPNIYAAATSAYGLQIVLPGGSGAPKRLRTGQPGAVFMAGQFGPAPEGGPGSIWKIDGATGAVSLFANIKSGGVANSGPGLGNLAYDPVHGQLFVSDLDTGIIHRLDMSGRDLGTFDHGVQGLPVTGSAPVLPDPANRADITSASFDAENANSWGFADPRRRVWGLAFFDNRLYYAVEDGPRIWSVAIAADGAFTTEVRQEIDVVPGGFPVSDMLFTTAGDMILAQRGGILGSFDYTQFHTPQANRVLRYRRDETGKWMTVADEYAIGFAGDHKNAAGGVATGCDHVLWSTGDSLRDSTWDAAALARGGEAIVHGVQGNDLALVRPDNVPPWKSLFIDFDGRFDDPAKAGHAGDVEQFRICAGDAAGAESPLPPLPEGPAPAGPAPSGTPEPDLEVTKVHSGAPCVANASCAYIIRITNVGSAPFSGPLYISDSLPPGSIFDSTQPPWNCQVTNAAGNVVECYHAPVTLPPGDSIGLPVMLRLPASMANVKEIENCASIIWMMNAPPNTIVIEQALSLAGYTVGPVDGVLDATTMNAITQFQQDHGLAPTGTITDALVSALFGGTAGLGDANPANDGACVTVPLTPPGGTIIPPSPLPVDKVDLKITKTHTGGDCKPGGKCSFRITVSNVGKVDYKGTIRFTDKLPAGWTLDSHHGGLAAVWTCTPKGGNSFTCAFTPGVPIPAGSRFPPGDKVSVTITASVPASAKGPDAENCVTIKENPKMPQSPGTKGNDKACAKVSLPAPQQTGLDLAIRKDIAGMIQGCKPDSNCTFTITITNNGPGSYHHQVVFEDAMPVGWTFVSQSGGGWEKCTVKGRILRCATHPVLQTNPPIVTLKAAEKITLKLVLKTPPAKGKDKKVWNCAKVFPHASAGDTTPGNDKSCVLLDVPGKPKQKKAPDLRIFKTGPASCKNGFHCTYKIMVINYGNAPFEGNLSITESNMPGVTYHTHTPKSPGWACKDLGGGKIRCDYGKVKLGYMQFALPLVLTVTWPDLPSQVTTMKDCASIHWTGKWAGKGDGNTSNDRACVTTPVDRTPNVITGHTDWSKLLPWNWFSAGTASCTPPNCSFFEFTASLGKTAESQAYDGPLHIRIELPPKSDFPTARVTASSPACSASGWSCTKTGSGYDCRAARCRVSPGERISIRLDGHVAPELKTPPPVRETRTACGVLEWHVGDSSGGIEQQGTGLRTARSCATTVILPRREAVVPPAPERVICPRGWRRFTSRSSVPEGWEQERIGRGGNAIVCGRYVAPPPPPSPAATCPRNGKLVPRGWVRRGWQVRRMRRGGATIFCAWKLRTPPVRVFCPRGWRPIPAGGRVPRGWITMRAGADRNGRLCARPGRTSPPSPPVERCQDGRWDAIEQRCVGVVPPPRRPSCIGGTLITLRTMPPRYVCRCPRGQRPARGRCVTIRRPAPSPRPVVCRRGQRLVRGRCVTVRRPAPPPRPVVCGRGQRLVRGRCVTVRRPAPPPRPVLCRRGERLVRGRCVTIRPRPVPRPELRPVPVPRPIPRPEPRPAPRPRPSIAPVPAVPKLQVIPTPLRIICPRGQVVYRGRCVKPVQ